MFYKRIDLVLIFILFLTLPLFFYKLGQSSLASFDEAWYAEISRNILKSNNLLNLFFNGKPYYDHPPLGFYLEAITFKIFGVSEFWAKFPQALSGFLSLIVTYFLGKELFGRVIGFASAIGLSSTFWFVYRARSGNLDILLTLLFLLTFLFAFKSSKEKNYLIPFAVSLSCLFLTKTLVPFTIVPSLAIIFWKNKLRVKDFIKPGILFIALTGSWFVSQVFIQPYFINRYFSIGLPGVKVNTNYLENFKQMKEYLHVGIGKWFWLGVSSVFLGLIIREKRFYALLVFFFIFSLPFIFSTRGNIWHLIPLYPILIIIFFGLVFVLLQKFIKSKIIVNLLIVGVSIYFSFMQIKQMWYQFIDIDPYVSHEAILSKESSKYPYRLILDEDFLPLAIFYSGKGSATIISKDEFVPYFDGKQSFLMITKQERLDGAKVLKDQYTILKSDSDKILVLKQ